MNRRRLTLIEVLEPRCFNTTPERSRVTRTIVQPEIDAFELLEAQTVGASSSGNTSVSAEKSALAGRRTSPPPQLAPQLVGA